MKFVKKLFVVLIMMFAVVALVACGEKGNTEDPVVEDSIVINFDTQGGSAIEKMTVKVSDATNFKLPADPTKEGYAFVGWYLDAQYKNEFKNIEAKKGEITLYAKWETVSSTSIVIKFDSKGGSAVANVVIDVTKPDLTKLAVAPVLEGKVFLGWFLDEEYQNAFSASALATLLQKKEVTLYAKWGEQGELPTTISFSVKLNGALDLDAKSIHTDSEYVDGEYVESEKEEVQKGNAKGEITIDLALTPGETFEEFALALTVGFSAEVKAEGEQDQNYPKMEIKVFLNNGILYALIPGALMDSESDMGVCVNLVNVYETNIETVKEIIEELVEMIKAIPADELPEGLDLSILDRIDLDNLTLEDLLALKDLLPEEYGALIENPEEFDLDSVFGLVEELVLPQMDLELTEAQINKIEEILDGLFEVLKGLAPQATTTASSMKWEITDEQVKGVIDDLDAYIKVRANDIYDLVYAVINAMFDSPEKEIDVDYYEEFESGEVIYFFQPKYIDAEGNTHFYREEVAANPDTEYLDHGTVVGRFYFLNVYPYIEYAGYSCAFDMEAGWTSCVLDTSVYYEAEDTYYYNLYLFKGKDELYDSKTKQFISIAAAYELVKDAQYPPIEYSETDHCYSIYQYYFGEDGKRLTEEEISKLPSAAAEKEQTVGMITQMADFYSEVIKDSFELKQAYIEVTMGTLLPEKLEGALEFAFDIDSTKDPMDLEEGEYAKANVKVGLEAGLLIEAAEIQFPDLTTFMDMTEMVNGLIAGYLEEVMGYLSGEEMEEGYIG